MTECPKCNIGTLEQFDQGFQGDMAYARLQCTVCGVEVEHRYDHEKWAVGEDWENWAKSKDGLSEQFFDSEITSNEALQIGVCINKATNVMDKLVLEEALDDLIGAIASTNLDTEWLQDRIMGIYDRVTQEGEIPDKELHDLLQLVREFVEEN